MCGHIFRALQKRFCKGCQSSIPRVRWTNLTKKMFERGSVLCIKFFLTLSEEFHKCFKSCIERIKMNPSEKICWLCAEDFWIFSRKFWAGLSKLFFTCVTKRCSGIVFEHFCEFVLKKNGRVVKICYLHVQLISLGIFLPESERKILGLWSVNVRMVIKIQSFLSDGSFLGNKFFWTFCGLQAKKF